MKKVCLTVLLVCIAVFSVHSQSGVIRELNGDVQLKPAGASDFSPAQAGSTVAQDTIISTGFRSSALIAIGSTVITVSPLTRLSLAEISSSAGTENLNVNLQTGRVRVDVTPPAGTRANIAVQAPNATASVRGTSFEMDTRNLHVSSGSVNWQDESGFSTAVRSGSSSGIGDTGRVVDPARIAQIELAPISPVGSGDAWESIGTSVNNDPDTGNVDLGILW